MTNPTFNFPRLSKLYALLNNNASFRSPFLCYELNKENKNLSTAVTKRASTVINLRNLRDLERVEVLTIAV